MSFKDGTYSDFQDDQVTFTRKKKKKPPPPKIKPRPKGKPPRVARKRDDDKFSTKESKEDEVVVTVKKEIKSKKKRSRRSHDFKFLLWWYYQSHCCAHILFWLGMNAVLWKGSDLDEANDYGNKPLGIIICVRFFSSQPTISLNISLQHPTRLFVYSGLSYLYGSVCL